VNNQPHKAIKLADYKPPEYLIDTIQLTFKLDEKDTVIKADTAFIKNHESDATENNLYLYGDSLELLEARIDNVTLNDDRLTNTSDGLIISKVPDAFSLQITTKINPEANTALSGLYLSSGNFCTQCEAEGFRRITYYPDRPDVLARFSTRIEADAVKYPVLLSNGNLVDSGVLKNGYHYAQWEDPYPKPSYLFALVAGDLVSINDTFETSSGRKIDLHIYVQEKNKHKCDHAMTSLKKAMKWDEKNYGLEYDLDRYMIVAVDDFNMGAMENKGLNIFNSKYVLASPETATDQDFLGIEGVIGHEYFHNWTGNRVTCRDWFQLSLKEGLTVFRDQEFSSDLNSRPVKRIEDVKLLRQFQFREDSGPMAHPVRPDSYMEINNFYTVTVYNKGAEVVRMIHTLIGSENFRRGMDLYFQRHDGQAVTCDDFVAAMSDASGTDLVQFKRWYSQAGTPKLSITDEWSEKDKTYTITVEQHTEITPHQPEKKSFHIPLLIGLLDNSGEDISTGVKTRCPLRETSFLAELTENTQQFSFSMLEKKPVASLLRTFSAPVRLEPFHTRAELTFLMANDTDLFNRWDASFSLAETIILELAETFRIGARPHLDRDYVEAIRKILVDNTIDKALAALAITLPTETYLAQLMDIIDPDSLHSSYFFVKKELARLLFSDFVEVYEKNYSSESYSADPAEMGRRSLRNTCLSYIVSLTEGDDAPISICREHYYTANNMTDQIAALSAVSHHLLPEREELLNNFEQCWNDDPLVMDKWFMIQAMSAAEDTYKRVVDLRRHPLFTLKNPNRIRSLIGAFSSNHYHFHDSSGNGYQFLADRIIELDGSNPQIAARLVTAMVTWQHYDKNRQQLIKKNLKRIQGKKHISRDVYEIVTKCLET